MIPADHGLFVMYNTSLPFSNPSSWQVFNANSTYGAYGYAGGCFDSTKFVYFSPSTKGLPYQVCLFSQKLKLTFFFVSKKSDEFIVFKIGYHKTILKSRLLEYFRFKQYLLRFERLFRSSLFGFIHFARSSSLWNYVW